MIRKAENADIKSIARIYSQLHKKHAEICPDYFNMPELSFFESRISETLSQGETSLIVYEQDDKIQGYAEVFVHEIQENENRKVYRRCFIQQLAVDTDCQRNGVGGKLVEDIKSYANEHFCHSVELGVWYENYNAVDFYGAMGFTPRMYKMEIKLVNNKIGGI